MRERLSVLLLLIFSGIASAQDTIFVKSGEVIPVTIVSKDNMEIKYKKFGQLEPAGIYSVFVSDIKSIHYKDGIIADYTAPAANENNKPQTPMGMAGKMGVIKISAGISGNYFDRSGSDNLQLFWQYLNGINTPEIKWKPVYYSLDMKTTFVIGQAGRNILGDELQLILMPKNAIYSSNDDGSNEISFRSFYYNIIIFYGHTLNHKKNLIAVFEPGFDISFMSGYLKIANTKYDNSADFGGGLHLAIGADWLISRRLQASLRIGQRFMKNEESHKSSTSSTGWSTFYVNHGINDDLVSVKWNGPYVSLGLAWSFYAKLKLGRPE
jgi:uncharacterized membrane protein YjdF